jgi:hypothetical protein
LPLASTIFVAPGIVAVVDELAVLAPDCELAPEELEVLLAAAVEIPVSLPAAAAVEESEVEPLQAARLPNEANNAARISDRCNFTVESVQGNC